MVKIGIILGSTRPGRKGEAVANWVLEHAQGRPGAEYELVDLLDHPLPHFDAGVPQGQAEYASEHTRRWAAEIVRFDGYVFVTPEYNHSIPGVLKNAIDHIYREWNDKAAAIVSYGGVAGGARAAEQLRLILAEVRIADVRAQVMLSGLWDYEDRTVLKPSALQPQFLEAVFDQVEAWSGALQPLRRAHH